VATIGNYDYAVNWIFRQDGSIGIACDLTGIMLAKGVPEATAKHHLSHAHLVAPHVAAPHHQHFFNFRLDLDVDGEKNTAFEMDTRAAPPTGMEMTELLLNRERMARRDVSLASARKWRIGRTGQTNALGYSPSFLLIPGGNAVPYLAPDTPTRRRAPFVDHHFFVTRYKDGERHAGGWFPNQSPGGTGLDAFAADDERLEGEDLVVWYTMGITHVPRPEEWPIMPVHKLTFDLLPAGFFPRSPALDVPRQSHQP
jgi:primary-amine oxidase